jgi:predicted phage tail protein
MALNSTSTIKIIDLLCEGPIEGIEGGKKGIFLDETPVKTGTVTNVSSEHFTYTLRTGTKNQEQLSNYQTGGASNLINFSEEIGSNYSETKNSKNKVTERNYGFGKTIKQITDNDTTSVQFLFTIPALFCTAMEGVARGQLFNATTRVRIVLKSKGTAFNEVYDKTFTGISTSAYQFKTPRIELEGEAPFLFKIQKLTNRENDYEVRKDQFEDIDINTPLEGTRANRVILTSMIERQDFKSRYPFTACVGLSLSTEAFASLPTRAYLVKGMRVKIPHNATVRSDGSLRFTGSFDGSLAVGRHWTTCPVCIFFDMLTSDKHGAGDFITTSNTSWVDLYPLAQYANQLVETPDGDEPRFAINTVIGAQNEAYKVLQNLASTFRGMTYWAANTVNVGADHGNLDGSDVDPVHLYTNANVIGGVFTYTGTSLKTRSTSIRVRYNDPDNLYKPNVVVVEDYDLITKYGYQVKDIVAFGCSSKYQAQRLGTWILKSEELDGEVVVFKTGLDGLAVLPSQVFAVADEMRQGVQRAGRIATGATTTSITLDKDLSSVLSSDPESFTLNCTLPDGTVESKTISAVSAATVTTAAFSDAPQSQSVYTITSSTLQHQKFRCIDVIDNNDGTYTIEGVQFNDSIYAAADTNSDLEYTDISAFDERPTPPTDLQHSVITIN